MRANTRFYIRDRDLKPILKETMKKHSPAVLLNPVRTTARLEIHLNGIHAMHLLVSIGTTVSNRDHEHQEIRMLLCNLRKYLNEVKRPGLPGILLGVRQTIEPRLKLIEQ